MRARNLFYTHLEDRAPLAPKSHVLKVIYLLYIIIEDYFLCNTNFICENIVLVTRYTAKWSLAGGSLSLAASRGLQNVKMLPLTNQDDKRNVSE